MLPVYEKSALIDPLEKQLDGSWRIADRYQTPAQELVL
jgi:hypothetical protein